MRKTSSACKLSLIIVNTNTKGLLRDCLRSVYRYPPSVPYEVFVVDNNSNDGSAEMIKLEYPQVILLQNDSNLGFSKSNNRAIKDCHGEYILLFNSDAETIAKTFDRMGAFMDDHPDAASCGATLLNPDGSVQMSFGTFPTFWQYVWQPLGLEMPRSLYKYIRGLWRLFFKEPTIILDKNDSRPRTVDYCCGACLMLRRKTIEEIGMLDEEYFVFSEESDWCLKALNAGWKNYLVPDAFAVHKKHGTFSNTQGRMLVIYYDSLYKFVAKHSGQGKAKLLKAIHKRYFMFLRLYSRALDRFGRRIGSSERSGKYDTLCKDGFWDHP